MNAAFLQILGRLGIRQTNKHNKQMHRSVCLIRRQADSKKKCSKFDNVHGIKLLKIRNSVLVRNLFKVYSKSCSRQCNTIYEIDRKLNLTKLKTSWWWRNCQENSHWSEISIRVHPRLPLHAGSLLLHMQSAFVLVLI